MKLPRNKVWQNIEANKRKRYAHSYNFKAMTDLLRDEVNEWLGKNIYPNSDAKRAHLRNIDAATSYLKAKGVQS